MFQNVATLHSVIVLTGSHYPCELPTFLSSMCILAGRNLLAVQTQSQAQRLPGRANEVWVLNTSSVELHGHGILWYSSSLRLRKQKHCFSLPWPEYFLLALAPCTFILLFSQPSFFPPDTSFFSVFSFYVRKAFSFNSWGQRCNLLPCRNDLHIFFLVSGFWPKIVPLFFLTAYF